MTRAFRAYTWVVATLATGSLFLLDWGSLQSMEVRSWVGWSFLLLFGLISEHLALRIEVGKASGTSSSISFVLIFATVVLFGPAPTVLAAGGSWAISQFLIRRKAFTKALFNVSQITTSAALAGAALNSLGGTWSPDVLVIDPVPFVAFGTVFIASNMVLVSGAMALIERLPFFEVVGRIAGPKGSHVAYDLLVSPVALLVAVLYVEFGVGGLLGAAFTLFFIRRSYLTNFQLQAALNDLLQVLVKAIETRDPYTSGHSMRVSKLARRIAGAMGLPASKASEIETAALLHDIGKIDEVFDDILKKPADLTPQEREIIESHASRGADLLDSLSSVSDEIIACVRHHHERIDGKGYPDGISGEDIPLGARIIKVCDAIDAMLSDRPYRKALELSSVKEQLVMFAGIQFDVAVVAAAVRGSLLSDHRRELLLKRLQDSDISEQRSAEVASGRRLRTANPH